ncbi:hypothetical protein [Streptomyces sp. DT171]|uniref:hypothetical protein n=1 Tax=Streptomyces sp. DT171 TaxID=3416524 RepID=UPI003CEB4203
MMFPEDPLGLRGEIRIGGSWVDTTRDMLLREPITVTHGASRVGSLPDPASCTVLLNNRNGTYSPRNPRSPYYRKLGRNSALRITVPGAEPWLDLDGTTAATASTPAVPALLTTTALDVRVEATADWWAIGTGTLIGRWDPAGRRSWLLVLTDGMLQLRWSPDGGTGWSYAGRAPASLPVRAALRATLTTTGTVCTVRLYTAATLAGPWAQIGADVTVTASAAGIYAGTAPLAIAPAPVESGTTWLPIAGRIHRAEVRSGVDGPIVAAPDFRVLVPGTEGWSDSAGRAWTAAPSTVTDREPLFTGEIAEWPQRWTPGDHSAWVPLTAAGILRRLGQGRRPLQSTLRRRIPSDPALIAYWPMEEEQGATQAYSPLDGVAPLRTTGLDYGADTTMPGAGALPTVRAPASLTATVPPMPGTGWHLECVYRLDALPAVAAELIRVRLAGAVMATVAVTVSASAARIELRDVDDVVIGGYTATTPATLSDFAGRWNRFQLFTATAGGTTYVSMCWRDVATRSWWVWTTSATTAPGRPTQVTGAWGSGLGGLSLGHLGVFSATGIAFPATAPAITIYEGADDGFAGETAIARVRRLAGEEPILQATTRPDEASERMGPQGQETALTLLSQCVEADGGILYERMDRLGLTYRARRTLYNQTPALVLDYAGGDVASPLEPDDDDADLVNDVTVTREGGSSGRSVVEDGPTSVLPPEEGGVGQYEEAVTLSLYEDGQAQPIAAWRAHVGAWDEARYPTVRVLLHRRPELIPAALRLRPGDLIRIEHPPIYTGPGPLDLIVRQVQHVPRPRAWEMTLMCVPASPYRIGVVGDQVRGRVDTSGSQLALPVTEADTTLSVAVTAGRPWITSAAAPAEFPFDAQMGGEVVTVTAITGTSSPQTWTVTRAVNRIEKGHSAGTDVRLANPTIVAL